MAACGLAKLPIAEGRAPVAVDPSNDAKGVDVRKVQALAALMSRHDLTLIDLRDGPVHIRLRRGQHGVHIAAAPTPGFGPAAPPPLPATSSATPAAPSPEKAVRFLHEIRSPTPGTFYAQEKPGSPPYVRVGDRVVPTKIVCQIEAMKIFNEIAAECTGALVEVLVEDKQPVEYGQVLFRVDPNG
jgi:acetyl-CoA carboxylase biotin carboxyl carrier protein